MDNDKKDISTVQNKAIEEISQNLDHKEGAINSVLVLGVGRGKTRIAVNLLKEKTKNGFSLVIAPTEGILKDSWKKELEEYMPNQYGFITKDNFYEYFLPSKKVFHRHDRKRVYLITTSLLERIYRDSNDAENPDDYYRIVSYFKESKELQMVVFDEFHTISGSESTLVKKTAAELNRFNVLAMTATLYRGDEKKELQEIYKILGISEKDELKKNRFLIDKLEDEKSQFDKKGFVISYDWFKEEQEAVKAKNKELHKIKRENYIKEQDKGLRTKLDISELSIRYLPTKIKIIKNLLESFPKDDKVLIFDNSTEILENLFFEPWMKQYFPLQVHSKIKNDQREKNYNLFNANKDCRVLLCSERLNQAGLNLRAANRCIVFSSNCKLFNLKQMEGRIDRKNQEKDIFFYILYDEPLKPSKNLDQSNRIDTPQSVTENPEFENHILIRFQYKEKFDEDFIKFFPKKVNLEKEVFSQEESKREELDKEQSEGFLDLGGDNAFYESLKNFQENFGFDFGKFWYLSFAFP